MKELLDKLSSYNIFNYLFPGVVFVVLLSKISEYDLIQKDIITGAFLYYFIGLIISRVGSLFIEPFLKWINFLKFSEYSKFVSASKVDEKIDLFSEVNNMYRTLCSLFLLLAISKVYETYLSELTFFKNYGSVFIIVLLLILFVFSYRKQTSYITKRVESNQPTP
ncbi:MAG: hypothetical protein PF448_01065 [Bacteroidales bacterium]|jgi:hypothetical protein|nr:hypothetical protein [Bacteroidales bacterium]